MTLKSYITVPVNGLTHAQRNVKTPIRRGGHLFAVLSEIFISCAHASHPNKTWFDRGLGKIKMAHFFASRHTYE